MVCQIWLHCRRGDWRVSCLIGWVTKPSWVVIFSLITRDWFRDKLLSRYTYACWPNVGKDTFVASSFVLLAAIDGEYDGAVDGENGGIYVVDVSGLSLGFVWWCLLFQSITKNSVIFHLSAPPGKLIARWMTLFSTRKEWSDFEANWEQKLYLKVDKVVIISYY